MMKWGWKKAGQQWWDGNPQQSKWKRMQVKNLLTAPLTPPGENGFAQHPPGPLSPLQPRPASAASLAPPDSEGSLWRKLRLGNVKACIRVRFGKMRARAPESDIVTTTEEVFHQLGVGEVGGCSNSNPWVMAGSYFPSIVQKCLRFTKRK